MELDANKLGSRILEIERNLQKISHYANVSDDDFWADERNIYSIKHLLLENIESAGSICAHIAAKRLHLPVSSYGECFACLEKAAIITPGLSQKLQRMAKFRNFMVHQYWEINDRRVLEYARHNLEDFRDFMEAVKDYLNVNDQT